ACRHPLHIARRHAALVAQAVSMRHLAGQHISDGLDAAMRMPGEAGDIVRRVLVAEIVQKQKRIELRGFAKAEGALQLYARAFDGWLGLIDLSYSSKRHVYLLAPPGNPHGQRRNSLAPASLNSIESIQLKIKP